MISQRQSMHYSIGEQNTSASPVASLSYLPIPNSPRTSDKHEDKTPEKGTTTQGTRRNIFIVQKDDAVKHRFRLRYSPCSDAYYREWEDCVVSRVGGNIHGWEKGVYSFDSVERIVDSKNNRVYLERTPGSNTGILTWKMDFWPCGLVIDQVSIKVTSYNVDGGEVLIMLSSNETKKTISNIDGLGAVKMKEFENSKHLILSIHLIGETTEQKTRLFEQDLMSRAEYPLDIKITLKPPTEIYSKPVILLGLMFSNSQETTVDRRHYRTHSCSSGGGYLHLNIVQGKNIASSKDTAPDAQVKCYLLPDDRNVKSCKTGRSKKSSTPLWDEYFVIDGITRAQLRKKQLGIRVVNWQLGINKKNTRLGELRIGCTDVFDFHNFPSPSQLTRETKNNDGMIYKAVEEKQQSVFSFSAGETKQDNETNVFEAGNVSGNDKDLNRNDQDLNANINQVSVKKILNNDKHTNDNANTEENDCSSKETLKSLAFPAKDVCDEPGAKRPEDNTSNHKLHDSSSKKVKPKRPPPPSAIKLKEAIQTSSNNRPEEIDTASRIQSSPRKVTTPTLSRLIVAKSPLSPRMRSRRSSWGGESDLSLQSPRSAQSPGDYDGAESCQWDLMISRPKEWIYSWQVLEAGSSE